MAQADAARAWAYEMAWRVAGLHRTLSASRGLGLRAKRILIPSENKRDLADVPDEVLNKLVPVFFTDPIHAAIRAMRLE
jgi:ATP-dependent Lon protease